MKIGTKSNAINDLGKFDGSNMTIKVNGKQIYPQKRYSIVRVDNGWCPLLESNKLCDTAKDCFSCKIEKRYGDTKKQMIQKILQAIIIDIVKTAKVNDKKTIQILYKANYKLAKFIVEFLGVE